MTPPNGLTRSCVVLAMASLLGACGTAGYQPDQQSLAPIEVIESNYVESTNDAEIVFVDLPFQACAASLSA